MWDIALVTLKALKRVLCVTGVFLYGDSWPQATSRRVALGLGVAVGGMMETWDRHGEG